MRGAAILIVTILHALLLLLIWKSRQLLIIDDVSVDRFIEWVPIEPARERLLPSSPREPDLRTPERTIIEVQQPSSSPESATPAAEPLPPRQIDWNAHGAYAAKKAVEGSVGEPYRNFGPRKSGPPPGPGAPALFEEEKDKFGEEGTDIHGDPVVWLSKHCYQELEKTVQTARDWVDPRPRLQLCMFPAGSPEPRGDLFEHLKKEKALPETKEGVERELPEREPDIEL